MRRKTILRLEYLEARVLLTGPTDFLVNTTLSGNHLDPAVAADGQGNFVVAWDGFNPANGTTDVFAQRFHPDGTPSGNELVVNANTAGTQQFPRVAADAAGDFVVVWTGPNPANGKTDVWGRRFDNNGNPATPNDVLLDPGTEGLDSGARVAMSADGSLVVVSRTGKVGGVADIYAERYDGSLNPLGSTFRVNQVHTGSVSGSRLAMDAAGNFTLLWNTLASNGLLTVGGRRFDNQGNALTNDLAVSGTPVGGGETNLALAIAPDGGFLAAWDGVNPTTHKLQVSALRYDAAGQPGTPFAVSDPATSADFAAVGFDASGNSVIAWDTQGSGTPVPDAVFAQAYDSAGNPSGPAAQLNVQPASDLSSVVLAEAAGGTYLAVWPSLNADHTTTAVRATLTAAAAQPPVLTSLTGTLTGNEGDTFQYHASATDPNGDALTYSWDLNGDGVFGDATGPDVQTVFTLAGQHNVSVQVSDAHGLSAVGSLAVAVQNVPPVALPGPAQTINEGDTAAFQGAVSDPGAPSETYTYFWDFDYDGQTFNPQASGAAAQHTYIHPGTYQVALQVLDNHGGAGLGVTTVTAQPDSPTASAGPDQAVVEGSSVTLHGTVSDPDFSLDSFQDSWVVTRNGATFASGSTPDFTCTPDDSGTYLATFTVTEADGGTSSSTATVTVADAPLSGQAVAVTATEGADTGTVAVATFTDTGITEPVSAYTALVDWGDGTPATPGTITLTGNTFTVSGDHTYAEEGSPTVTVTVGEDGGSSAGVTGTATVADAGLAASGGNLTATEGTSFSGVVGSFTDADPTAPLADYSATITWGDGSTSAGSIAPDGNGGFLVSGGHTYAEEGSFAVGVTITDVGGATAQASGTAAVADAPLTATTALTDPVAGVPFTAVVASFTDADPTAPPSDYRATISWGDGTTSAGTVQANGQGGFNVSGTTTYAAGGSYVVTVQVTDAGGSTVTVGGTLQVTSPTLPIQPGDTASADFWRDRSGQALLRSFNGGPNVTRLATWLATTFPDLYGKAAGGHNLAGKTNAQVAAFYRDLYEDASPPVGAEVLAAALNVYATTLSLGGTAGLGYGFHVTAAGLGACSFNVHKHGAPFGVANGTTLTVSQLLSAADQQAVHGVPWAGNVVAQLQADAVLIALNLAGDANGGAWAALVEALFASGAW